MPFDAVAALGGFLLACIHWNGDAPPPISEDMVRLGCVFAAGLGAWGTGLLAYAANRPVAVWAAWGFLASGGWAWLASPLFLMIPGVVVVATFVYMVLEHLIVRWTTGRRARARRPRATPPPPPRETTHAMVKVSVFQRGLPPPPRARPPRAK